MAAKKSVRKTSSKKPLQSKISAKKKAVTQKGKAKPAAKPSANKKNKKSSSGKKGTGVAKKTKKVIKPIVKKKTPVKAASGKKGVTKKTVAKKKKATPPKAGPKVVSKVKTKKTAKKKPVLQKKKTSSAKKKVKTSQAKKPITKRATSSAPTAPRLPKTKEPLLSSTERYNIGGLFACAMERRHDPDCSRLRAVLRHLDLSAQEKDNLIRLSEGFMIPKLFAENLPEQKVNQLLADLVKFGLAQGSYEKYWREEIQQIGFWLGVFPAQFQAIEQQVKR
jgi:hypothetical protein